MIAYLNPLQGEEFLDLCCVEPIIGARICSWYCCYANAYPFCDLWILYSDKKNPDFPAAGNHLGYPHGVALCASPATWRWTSRSWPSL